MWNESHKHQRVRQDAQDYERNNESFTEKTRFLESLLDKLGYDVDLRNRPEIMRSKRVGLD